MLYNIEMQEFQCLIGILSRLDPGARVTGTMVTFQCLIGILSRLDAA